MAFDPTTWNASFFETASDDDRRLYRSWVSWIFMQNTSVTVVYSDGTNEHTLNGTLNVTYINDLFSAMDDATQLEKAAINTLTDSNHAITVWDKDNNEWVSFGIDKILEITFDLDHWERPTLT